MEPQYILVKGARQHNLKNIDVKIPRNQLVVITGLSGSGKSSLAFDTIYAEGQRRYVESLSAYARQFLEQMGKPDVDTIEGLSPAISIEQKTTSHNPRSTVGTVTEIYDYFRLLFARVGHPHCYQCGKPIQSQTVTQMVDRILEFPEKTRLHVLAPVVRGRKGEYSQMLKNLQAQGFVRVKIDGETHLLGEEPKLNKKIKHNIDLYVDRLIVKPDVKTRLADSIETALKFGEGLVKVEVLAEKGDTVSETLLFSEKFSCMDCGLSFEEISPRLFSFNNPHGACPECKGLGSKMFFDPDLVVPNSDLNLDEGAIIPWYSKTATYYPQMLASLGTAFDFSLKTPWKELSKKHQEIILYGSKGKKVDFVYQRKGRSQVYSSVFEGVLNNLERRYRETESDWMRQELEKFMSHQECSVCQGSRLKREATAVKVGNMTIYEMTTLSVQKCLQVLQTLQFSPREAQIAERILKEIIERLSFLQNVGLDYLTLDRRSGTLSGGEGQRIRLATQIGSALVGVLYILDEPSIGLHQRDNSKLLGTLKRLRDLGNTVLVVEHDEETMFEADFIIDMGPGAGHAGGDVVAAGPPEVILEDEKSLTGLFLSKKREIETPKKRRSGNGKKLKIESCQANNLKNLSAEIPLGTLTCVTGVSGSGKSTLINDTLYAALAQKLNKSRELPGKHQKLLGVEHIDKVINIDQSPIGRTPRSNPATYTGLFTLIRDLFTGLPEAKVRGYKPGRFSFNVKGGRCEACEGDGMIKIEMHFLPDIYVECEECKGARYNRETLEVLYKSKSIADVLAMSIDDALDFFKNIPGVQRKLQTLHDVGLGYMSVGQSATTLSGGEAQRIKLSRELSKRSTGKTFYILDEPTTGLHFADIHCLLEVLQRLVDAGNSVVVIEHNLDVIKSADYIIDLGPEGGDRGGEIVVTGTPEEVAKFPKSYTGQYLKKVLNSGKPLLSRQKKSS
ncbi:MAG: excinuclease ABC subunit UvrA [Deltaproteobacteria bacterium]|nr:excinuclease ABC subunit UvrA [Deltaproteobacteria bacterium]